MLNSPTKVLCQTEAYSIVQTELDSVPGFLQLRMNWQNSASDEAAFIKSYKTEEDRVEALQALQSLAESLKPKQLGEQSGNPFAGLTAEGTRNKLMELNCPRLPRLTTIADKWSADERGIAGVALAHFLYWTSKA